MPSFFTLPKSQKRKRTDLPNSFQPKKPRTTTSAPASRGSRSNQPSLPRPQARDDESISGSESDLSGAAGNEGYESASTDASEERESAAEKRLRLAEEYLEKVRQETEADAALTGAEYGFDAEQIDRDLIAERLKEDVAEQKGRIYRFICAQYDWTQAQGGFAREGAEKAVTAVAMGKKAREDGEEEVFAYTATKDARILKWKLRPRSEETQIDGAERGTTRPELSKSQRRKLRAKRKKEVGGKSGGPVLVASTRGDHRRKKDNTYDHHVASILCLACSPSGHLLVSGGADKRIVVWDAETLTPKRVFTQHRDAVTGLTFTRNTNQLFSACADRTIKVWSMDELAYVETLFGHQNQVLDVGALGAERCVSVGGQDRTARVWKVVEETQLVFRGGGTAAEKESKRDRKKGINGTETEAARADKKSKSGLGETSIDRVALVDDEMFVTGSDNGSLSLWSIQKKKPVHTVALAHGLDPQLSLEEAFADVSMEDREVPGPSLPRSITALAVLPYSDVVISGSWEGFLRIWRITKDKKRLEPVGTLGKKLTLDEFPLSINANGLVNGASSKITFATDIDTSGVNKTLTDDNVEVEVAGQLIETDSDKNEDEPKINGTAADNGSTHLPAAQYRPFSGIVNDLNITERGKRGKETLIIAAAIGREPRLGRWRMFSGRNGACVYEIGRPQLHLAVNGTGDAGGDETNESP